MSDSGKHEGFVWRVALAATIAAVVVLAAACANPLAGSRGLGDPYLPNSGNGGYDVQHYQLDLTVDPVSGNLDGTATITATTTQDLAAFDLDFNWGAKIASVAIDGAAAKFRDSGGELVVTCPGTLHSGHDFSVAVVYSGKSKSIKDMAGPLSLGWQRAGATSFTLDEPSGASTWFPVNDYPTDKATYSFRITVPKPYQAAANGVLTSTEDKGADQTFSWEMKQPMASYLASVTVGAYVVEKSTAPDGVPIRNYFDESLVPECEKAFARTGDVITYFSGLFGPYPFDAYGVVVPAANTDSGMENQTLSLYGKDIVSERMLGDPVGRDVYLSHEIAHQWFGNSVTIEQWKDIWLNEGFAEYCSWLWLEHDQGTQALSAIVDQTMQSLRGTRYPPLSDPGVDGLFSANVYGRGALTLHALRLTVGDQAFFAILKQWATRYKYGNATIAEFIALCQELAPRVDPGTLTAFFNVWLNQKTPVPDLPGPSSITEAAR